MNESYPQSIQLPSNERLMYHHIHGDSPGVMFLGGFNSSMKGTKATTLESWCRDNRRAYTRFDYRGHGESDGKFEDGSIGDWLQDTLAIIDYIDHQPLVLVGSSMGAWIMLLSAIHRPNRIAGLLGIASAADFTEILFNSRMNDLEREQLVNQGYVKRQSAYDEDPYIYTKKLIEDGRDNLLLDRSIPINVPTRLIHSVDDPDVPWQVSAKILKQLTTNDAELTLLKDAGHRLSRPADLELISHKLKQLLASI